MLPFRAVFLDLGGVVYLGDAPLPGAIEAVARLRRAGFAVRFLTNTTRTPHRVLLEKLGAMGLSPEPQDLFTPALAARRFIERERLGVHLLVHPDLMEDFAGLPQTGKMAVVVGDAAEHFTYSSLNDAFRVLDKGAKFLALANNRSFRASDGELSLDAGPFVAALTFASGREPTVLGKPAPGFFGAALASVGCEAHEAVMIGDDAENDVRGAMTAGLSGILVRTGKYREGVEAALDPRPTAVADDLAAATEMLVSGTVP